MSMLKITLVAAHAAAVLAAPVARPPARCNPEELRRIESHPGNVPVKDGSVPLTLLPLTENGPACLDGSAYGFYFQPSKSGSTKWTVSINGGGWCYDEIDCYCRSKTSLGTSKADAPTGSCGCINPLPDGSMDTDCNCIHMPYSDGASFAGNREGVQPVPAVFGVPEGANVTFRGIQNLDGVIDFAMAHGMTSATEFVVTGGSAGGLSTFLHADRFAAALKTKAPKCTKIRAAPVVGYFLDHDNFAHTTGFPGGPNTPQWAKPGTGANYTTWMKYIYTMQHLTFGADGGLMAACQAKHADEPWLCFMSPHMQDVIDTPFFMFNSKYDAWQLGNEFQSSWATEAEQKGVLQYGTDFMAQLAPVYTGGETKNGGMITSCICHGCPWSTLELEGKTSYEWYADWFYGKTTGAASMHIDPRLPNGNGTLLAPAFKQCAKYP